MTRTVPTSDVQVPAAGELAEFFRGRVPGDSDRWVAVWGAWDEQAEERRAYCIDDPDEWPAERETITRALRRGMAAGRVVTPSGLVRGAALGGSTELVAHEQARSVALAVEAARLPGVTEFRDRWIAGGLLATDAEVDQWASDHAGDETIVVWSTERDDGVLSLSDAVAGELRLAMGDLWTVYGWFDAMAAAFVLTGVTPFTPMLSVSHVITTGRAVLSSGLHDGGWGGYVVLRVHPDVPVGEVADAYRQHQSSAFGVRAKLMSDRVCEAVERSTYAPGPRAANKGMSQPYADAGDFRRTVERAKSRMLRNPAVVTGPDKVF